MDVYLDPIDSNDLIVIMRALYWYQDKVQNQDEKFKDFEEWDRVEVVRKVIGRTLKKLTYID